MRESLVAIGGTVAVPRQLASSMLGLESALLRVVLLLSSLQETDEGRQILMGLKNTKKFDPVPSHSQSALEELKEEMDLVAAN